MTLCNGIKCAIVSNVVTTTNTHLQPAERPAESEADMPATITTDPAILDRLAASCGSTFPALTEPAITLTVAHRIGLAYQSHAEVGPCRAAVLTADGRHANLAEWHTEADGAEAEWIYYERIAADGTGSHGWVDADSRKLLQAG